MKSTVSRSNRTAVAFCFFFAGAVLLGAALRLPRLGQRPMHTDEAVHAIKFGQLLENRYYRYDPVDYHGPTLNYFTLIPAWLTSKQRMADLTESTLRIVPAVFGLGLILLLLLLRRGIGFSATLLSAFFTAASPALAFYSRYYIQEILFVCFSFGVIVSGFRYWQSGRALWMILAGVFLGLMIASKETWVLAVAAMVVGAALANLLPKHGQHAGWSSWKQVSPAHVALGLAVALCTSSMFYSSFFSNPNGIIDSLRSLTHYISRGAGREEAHLHGFFYYFRLLLFGKAPGGPIWTEAFVLSLATIGMGVAVVSPHRLGGTHRGLSRFLAFYSLTLALMYCSIPYKTPWTMLGFYHGFVLMAALGAVYLLAAAPKRPVRVLIVSFLVLGTTYLSYLAYMANYRYECDPTNPYVYAHTSPDVPLLAQRVEELAKLHPDGEEMYVEVVCPKHDYWPLPWYLRRLANVGYWDQIDLNTPPGPIVIVKPEVEADLLVQLYEIPGPGHRDLYVPLFDRALELRPGVELRAYVVKALWDQYVRSSSAGSEQ